MTERQFYDWQTAGGADDVMCMADALERAELHWCAIGGIAVNHWATEPMVTRDIDFVVAVEEIDRAVAALEAVGFQAERHDGSVNFRGRSQVGLQLSTEDFYRDFPTRSGSPEHIPGLVWKGGRPSCLCRLALPLSTGETGLSRWARMKLPLQVLNVAPSSEADSR